MSTVHRVHVPIVSDDDFERLVLAGSKEGLVAVEFYSPGCPDSRAQGSAVDAAVAATRGRVQWYNVNAELERGLTARWGVSHTPTVLVFSNGHALHGPTGGPLSAGELLDLVFSNPRR